MPPPSRGRPGGGAAAAGGTGNPGAVPTLPVEGRPAAQQDGPAGENCGSEGSRSSAANGDTVGVGRAHDAAGDSGAPSRPRAYALRRSPTTHSRAQLADLELYQLGWRALVSLPGLPELPAFGAARDVLPPRLQEELREKTTALARPVETAMTAAPAAAAGSQGKSPTRKAKPKAAAPAAAKPKTSAPAASKAPAPARPPSAGAKAAPAKSPPKARPTSPAKAPTAKAAAATPARSASPARAAKAPASATPARGASPARGGRPAAPPKAGAPKAGAPKAAAPQAAAPSASKGAGGKGGKGGKLNGALAPRAKESLAEVLVGRQTLANLVRDCERDEAALREHLSQAHATLRSMCQLGASELGLAKVPNGVASAHAEANCHDSEV